RCQYNKKHRRRAKSDAGCGNAPTDHRPLREWQVGWGWPSLNSQDNQRIKTKRGDVTEIAEEPHKRGGRHPDPRSPRFESEPQSRAAQREADPEQVIDKAPQKNPIVEQQKGK